MNRLLIVITRMYAERGDSEKDGGDEFVTVWGADPALEHFSLSCSAGGQDYRLLVMHGYDYPDDIQQAIKTAQASVESALALPELSEEIPKLKVGLTFHLRPYWNSVEKEQFRDAIEKFLKAKIITPTFVSKFSHDTPIEKVLAPQCRATPHDFSKGFIETWNFFFLPTKMSETRHSIVGLFKVIDQDLQWWKDINFEDSDEVQTIFSDVKNRKPLQLLQEARRLVLGDTGIDVKASENIKSITEQVILDLPERKALIEKAMHEVEVLFSNSAYAEAERTLSLLSNEDQKTPDKMLDDLRQHMRAGKSLLEWYGELLAALEKLKNELIVKE